ncbi:DUF3466 family protein [Alteromonas pelagimontana]|uniref:DUF3466 family protein n=1 Tax=Alteromonas pelagimontana TaxID=1858656 RepID=A0A6M4MI71_9ALTE|nr:DUF3466 family protein [Alteromonas pelagimontana]QJR82618.1 DUF3466 family protein [Alteromonas pelagimontana]
MKLTQLTAAVLLATGSLSAAAATYSVTPLPVQDIAKDNYAQSIDNTGSMLTTVQYEFNPPIDLERLEDSGFYDASTYGNTSYSLEDEDDIRQGIFSNADFSTIYNFILYYSSNNNVLTQHLAPYRSYVSDTVDADLVPGFDEVSEKFDDYSRSVRTIARDSLNRNVIVGVSEGLYTDLEYTNEDDEEVTYTYNTMRDQAFAQVNGVTKRLAPEDTTLNGLSYAYAVNDNLQVAGYGTTSFLDSLDTAIEECNDDEERGDQPVEICLRNILYTSAYSAAAQVRATIWQLDGTGDVINLTTYPLLFTPEEDSTASYATRAYDINNNGIAVGDSATGETVYISAYQSRSVATSFANGETTELLPRDENITSRALSINDENWITGWALRKPGSYARERLFAYNLDTGEARYPQGFFINSATIGNAINNNNIIVGSSEFNYASDTNRETHAFMYDIQSDEFTDLNDLVGCDSEYTLVDAIDINDNNEIIANARVRVPARYANGNEILNSAGETVLQDTIVAVKLSPLNSETTDSCDVDGDEEESYERQGAAVSPLWLLTLAGFLGFRRRK